MKDEKDDLGNDIEETESSFPEIPDLASQANQSTIRSLETTEGLISAAEEFRGTSPVHEADTDSSEPLSVLGPLIVLVILPVVLVALITLAWWLFG